MRHMTIHAIAAVRADPVMRMLLQLARVLGTLVTLRARLVASHPGLQLIISPGVQVNGFIGMHLVARQAGKLACLKTG